MKKILIFSICLCFSSADIVSHEQKFGRSYDQNTKPSFNDNNKEAQEEIIGLIYYDTCEYGLCANQWFTESLSDELLDKIKKCLNKQGESFLPSMLDTIINKEKLNFYDSMETVADMDISTNNNVTSVRFNKFAKMNRDFIFECDYSVGCKIKDIHDTYFNQTLLKELNQCLATKK